MVFFHLHIGYRSRDGCTSCNSARQYLAREGPYVNRGDRIRWVQSLHMPPWSGTGSAEIYWRAAEGKFSRVNARTALTIGFALPKALLVPDQNALALAMADLLASMAIEGGPASTRMPVTLALHEGFGRNPHIHVLLSTSIVDAHVRSADTWFLRHRPESPEKGGARRSTYVTKRRWVHRVRQAWAALANAALLRCGLAPTLDHRSHATRGLVVEPQIHLGSRIAHLKAQGIETARAARHAAIERRNAERMALEARIARRRRTLADLEFRNMVTQHAERVWAKLWDDEWRVILAGHRLAGNIADLMSQATAMVLETDLANVGAVSAALWAEPDARRFATSMGRTWDPVSTKDGFWAVRPGQDTVVLLGPGYVATDAEDEAAMVALIGAAQTLPLARPAVWALDKLASIADGVVERLGLDWPVLRLKAPRPAPK